MADHKHKHHLNSAQRQGEKEKLPTRPEVIRIVVLFIVFFAISIWCAVSFLKIGISGFTLTRAYRFNGIETGIELFLFPIIATVMLGLELLRIRRVFRRFKRHTTDNPDATKP